VKKGDVIGEIETDKTTMDLEAYDEGVLEQILVDEGGTVAIGEPIAVLGDGSGSSAKPDNGSTGGKDAESGAAESGDGESAKSSAGEEAAEGESGADEAGAEESGAEDSGADETASGSKTDARAGAA